MKQDAKSSGQTIPEVDERLLLPFIEKFISTMGAVKRYSADSQLVSESSKTLLARIRDLQPNMSDMTLHELHGLMFLNDKPLSDRLQQHALVGAFLLFMLERNLRQIKFTCTCPQRDLDKFMRLLVEWPESARANPQVALLHEGVNGVDLIPQGVFEFPEPKTGISKLPSILENRLEQAIFAPPVHGLEEVDIAPLVDFPAGSEPTPKPSRKHSPTIKLPQRSTTSKIFEEDSLNFEEPLIPKRKQVSKSKDEPPKQIKTKFSAKAPEKGLHEIAGTSVINVRSLGKEATNIMRRPSRRDMFRDVARPPGTVHLVVMTKLGRTIMDGAVVTLLGKPPVSKTTSANLGATFFLLPGKYNIQVKYEEYQLLCDLDLGTNDDEVLMDINLMDATD